MRLLPLLLVGACSEWALDGAMPAPEREPDHDPDALPGPATADPSETPVPTGPPSPDVPPDHEVPGDFLSTDCDPSLLAPFSEDEIWVGSRTRTSDHGWLTAPASGWYDLYNTHVVESGSSQHNESAYVRVPNPSNPDGLPVDGSCGGDRILRDADNEGPPPGSQVFVGTYWLDAGENLLELHHYCPRYRSGDCPEHHVPDPGSRSCDSDNINSVHFGGFAVCLVPVP